MVDVAQYFSIQIFFIILRETLETAIIISVLLSFINKREPAPNAANALQIRQINRGMRLQVWLGAVGGLAICMVIGLVFMFFFYFVEKDLWSYTERLWEGLFSLLLSVIITIMGVGLLRINKVMKIKWWIKLGDAYTDTSKLREQVVDVDAFDSLSALDSVNKAQSPELGENPGLAASETDNLRTGASDGDSRTLLLGKTARPRQKWSQRYFLAILPFVTTLREGLEAVVFVGGIGMSQPASSLPLAVLCGLLLGSAIGVSLYKGGNKLSLQYFLICSTCFLYVVSAGLMSRGVWFLELERYVRRCGGMDVSETGSGPGSYDISTAVWHVNCCNGLTDGWWMVANAIVGWSNTATYGSVISYILYWVVVSAWLRLRLYEEKHGYLPVLPVRWQIKRIRKKLRLYEALHQQQLLAESERRAEAAVI